MAGGADFSRPSRGDAPRRMWESLSMMGECYFFESFSRWAAFKRSASAWAESRARAGVSPEFGIAVNVAITVDGFLSTDQWTTVSPVVRFSVCEEMKNG